MSEISSVFENSSFGEVRTVNLDGEIWFVGVDITKALDYADATQAIRKNCRHARKVELYAKQGQKLGNSEMYVINEGDLYRLISRSRRPEAEKFEEWIFDEVVPTIRRTGGYVNNDELFIDTYLEGVSDEVKQLFRDHLAIIKEKNAKIKEMEPKAGYFDDLVDRKLHTNVRDTAKELGMKQKQFVKWLIDHEYVYRDAGKNLRPYSQYVGEDNLFVLKDAKSHFNDWAGIQMLITVRGKETFRLLLQGLQSFSNNEEDDGQLTLDLE